MTNFEQKKIDMEMKAFTSKNFERPGDCKNLEQIRFYVKELCSKIQELEERFNYAPDWAYALLAQYNAKQNTLIHVDFKNAYC